MLDAIFRDPHVVHRLRDGPLGDSIEELVRRLRKGGYALTTMQTYARGVGHLAYWLEAERVALVTVDETTVRRFIDEHLPRCRCPVPFGAPLCDLRAATGHMLVVLRDARSIPPRSVAPTRPLDRLLQDFAAELRKTRGVTAKTCTLYTRDVGEFLASKYAEGPVDLARLEARDVIAYVAQQAERYRPKTVKLVATALRWFLRFLEIRGLCGAALRTAVPTIPEWKLSRLPKVLTDDQLGALLASFDRATTNGRRDYAMAMCLAELGLRAAEVAQLSLDDVDWRSGAVRLRGKSRRESLLPLPIGVGRAIIAYLRRGRPLTAQRCIFVRHGVPVGAPLSSSAVRQAVRRGFKRARIDLACKGSHVLRHTAASRMLRGGATLKQLADVLRHRSIDTTAIYAKVDLPRLTEVALPWPEVRP